MVYIRVDMNEQIATGHLMRCLSIADAISKCGELVMFITADEKPKNILSKKGYSTFVLNTNWMDMDSEISIIRKVCQENKNSLLLIDSYQVTPTYLFEVKQIIKTVYIDDLNRFHYPVDGLICYVAYWEKFKHQTTYDRTIKLLLGTKYAPLRDVFNNCPKKKISQNVGTLLILSGGTDPYDFIWNILEEIQKRKYKEVHVICGVYYSRYDECCRFFATNSNLIFHKSIDNIEIYMNKADVAISAGGTTLYELCACGVPTITYTMADNQLDNVLEFQKEELMDYAGDIRKENVIKRIISLLDSKYASRSFRERRSEKMQKVIDGNGAKRIAEELIKSTVGD